MKLHALLILGLILGAMGCAEKEQAAPEQVDESVTAAPAEAAEAAAEAVDAALEEAPATETKTGRGAAFLDHMHAHAEMLDDISYALADDDLQAAMTPAYWLASHDTVVGVPEEWLPFVEGMRAAAREIETASDLETARAAAARINKNCQGCHSAAGIGVE